MKECAFTHVWIADILEEDSSGSDEDGSGSEGSESSSEEEEEEEGRDWGHLLLQSYTVRTNLLDKIMLHSYHNVYVLNTGEILAVQFIIDLT